MCAFKHRRGSCRLPFIVWILCVRNWTKFDKFWYQRFTLKHVEIMQSWFTAIKHKVYFGRSKFTCSSVSAFYGPPEIQRYEEVGARFHTMLLAETFERENVLDTFPSQSRHLMQKQFWNMPNVHMWRHRSHCQLILPTRATLYPV